MHADNKRINSEVHILLLILSLCHDKRLIIWLIAENYSFLTTTIILVKILNYTSNIV